MLQRKAHIVKLSTSTIYMYIYILRFPSVEGAGAGRILVDTQKQCRSNHVQGVGTSETNVGLKCIGSGVTQHCRDTEVWCTATRERRASGNTVFGVWEYSVPRSQASVLWPFKVK